MSLAVAHTVAMVGLDPRPVRVECSLTAGLPGLRLVGLPDAALREAVDRVRSAVGRQGLAWPGTRRVVVSLAPADLPKAGAGFDLPVAMAVLAAAGELPAAGLARWWSVGELGLDGRLRAVPGVLPVALGAQQAGAEGLLVPAVAAPEAALATGLRVVAVDDLAEAVAVVRGGRRPRPAQPAVAPDEPPVGPDLAEVRGQAVARRAVELAAAGGHHLLLAGPPGCGKTMLARRLHGLLPPLSPAHALEVAAIHSLAGERPPDAPLSRIPPLREPHHSVSVAGLVGGGSGVARPGELALAHRGLLLLDELLETPRYVLDALRQPLERAEVVLIRARSRVRYPCEVLLVAATNPCPCGHLGSPVRACRCRPDQIARYRSRLSGPLLDRLDLHVELTAVTRSELAGATAGETTATVAARVAAARTVAHRRWGRPNAHAPLAGMRETCTGQALRRLAAAVDALGLSARAFDRAVRVARTIADLDGSDTVVADHVEEAVAYRLSDTVVSA